MEQFPPVSKALVEALEARFPDRCPEPTTAERTVWMDSGSAKVCRFLRAMLVEQSETIL